MIELETKKENSAEKMEQYRKKMGISYTSIAKNYNVTPSYIRKLLLRKLPLPENMRKKINELWETDF